MHSSISVLLRSIPLRKSMRSLVSVSVTVAVFSVGISVVSGKPSRIKPSLTLKMLLDLVMRIEARVRVLLKLVMTPSVPF